VLEHGPLAPNRCNGFGVGAEIEAPVETVETGCCLGACWTPG